MSKNHFNEIYIVNEMLKCFAKTPIYACICCDDKNNMLRTLLNITFKRLANESVSSSAVLLCEIVDIRSTSLKRNRFFLYSRHLYMQNSTTFVHYYKQYSKYFLQQQSNSRKTAIWLVKNKTLSFMEPISGNVALLE